MRKLAVAVCAVGSTLFLCLLAANRESKPKHTFTLPPAGTPLNSVSDVPSLWNTGQEAYQSASSSALVSESNPSLISRVFVEDFKSHIHTMLLRNGLDTAVVVDCPGLTDYMKSLFEPVKLKCPEDYASWSGGERNGGVTPFASNVPSDSEAVAVVAIARGGNIDQKQVANMNIIISHAGKKLRAILQIGMSGDEVVNVLSYLIRENKQTLLIKASKPFHDTFRDIYLHRVWGGPNEAGGGGSGPGSSMGYTAALRPALVQLIAKYKIRSLLDSSCGSMHWMPTVLADIEKNDPAFRFGGSDVACHLIESHSKWSQEHPNWKFYCVDYTHESLPTGYDAIFSRDSLQHLPLRNVWMFLSNVKNSGARYLLVGSYIKANENSNVDIGAGGYYSVDLTKKPFNVRPPPLEIIDENSPEFAPDVKKHILLYDVKAMYWDDPMSVLNV